MAEMKCCHAVLPVTCICLLHEVMSGQVQHGCGPQHGKNRDLLDILPTLNQKHLSLNIFPQRIYGARRRSAVHEGKLKP